MAEENGHGGARPGSGRKRRFDEKDLETILTTGWPRAARVATIKKLSQRAQDGDEGAAALLLSYAYGRPKQRIEADVTLDVNSHTESVQRKLANLTARAVSDGVLSEPVAGGSAGA